MINEAVMKELKPMWVKLEEANLTSGLSFQAYLTHANNAFLIVELNDMLGI